jgi:signal transduction histidine kinase
LATLPSSSRSTGIPCREGAEVGKEYPYRLYTHCGIRDAWFDGRMWIADPVLDEATTSVDSEAEVLIQEALAKLIMGRTTLIIAHRLSSLHHAERIVILEDTRGDGRADRRTVFATGLNIPTSLAFADGGVIVHQAPQTLFLEDTTRAREQAQQLKLAALGRLTANIAHEIRNPLAAISHATELLREEKRAGDRERLTRIIHDNARRLERLVSDVLQLNKRDRASAAPLRLQPWLRAFVAEFVANEQVPPERIVLEMRRESWVEFDHEHLHQVMWNLLKNAARYARPEPGAIRVRLDGYADRVELSVLDNGPGVPAAIQGQLFEPFFTTEAKGTGLGLYIARELCAANRAALEYVNDASGAHFRIRCRQTPPK